MDTVYQNLDVNYQAKETGNECCSITKQN